MRQIHTCPHPSPLQVGRFVERIENGLAKSEMRGYTDSYYQNLSAPASLAEARKVKFMAVEILAYCNHRASRDGCRIFLVSFARNPLKSLDSEK
jgi:hypothetical protein